MLTISNRLHGLARPLLSTATLATVGAQEGLGERLKLAAEEAVHRAEDAIHRVEHKVEDTVHRVADKVHERREQAREEAERGMFTADDIREAAEQMLHSRDKQTKKREKREYHPDEEEQLLEDASSDLAKSWRQKELEGMRSAVKEEETQATEKMKRAGQEYKKDHPH